MQKVTAAIIRSRDKILIARRIPGKHLGRKWEFPGGKVRPGETPEECLKRELREEFSIETKIGKLFCASTYEDSDIRLEVLAYPVEHVSGIITLHEHEEIKWVTPAEFELYDLVDSDRPLARAILEANKG